MYPARHSLVKTEYYIIVFRKAPGRKTGVSTVFLGGVILDVRYGWPVQPVADPRRGYVSPKNELIIKPGPVQCPDSLPRIRQLIARWEISSKGTNPFPGISEILCVI